VPKKKLEALQALGYLGAGLWPFLLQGLCLKGLLFHCVEDFSTEANLHNWLKKRGLK
jgi:hypothetical protein